MTGGAAPLGLGPRGDDVEKVRRDLLTEQYGTCRACGGPRAPIVLLDGPLDAARGGYDPRTLLRCEDCGRRSPGASARARPLETP